MLVITAKSSTVRPSEVYMTELFYKVKKKQACVTMGLQKWRQLDRDYFIEDMQHHAFERND